jgi:hypothetical protein
MWCRLLWRACAVIWKIPLCPAPWDGTASELPHAVPIYLGVPSSRFRPFLNTVCYVESIDLPPAMFLNALCNSLKDSIRQYIFLNRLLPWDQTDWPPHCARQSYTTRGGTFHIIPKSNDIQFQHNTVFSIVSQVMFRSTTWFMLSFKFISMFRPRKGVVCMRWFA